MRLPQHTAWERFRRRTTPVLFPIVYYFRPFTARSARFPTISTVVQFTLRGADFQTILERRSFDRLQQWIFERIVRKRSSLRVQLGESRRYAHVWLRWCRSELTTERLRGASLASHYRTFQEYYERYSIKNIMYWTFLGDRLVEALDRELIPVIADASERQHILELMTTPTSWSFMQREELAFLRMAARLVGAPRQRVDAELARHSVRYGWIPWNYLGPSTWTVNGLVRRLRAVRSKHVITGRLLGIDRARRTLIASQQRVRRKWRLSEKAALLASAARDQAILQDDKKCVTTEAHYYLHFLQKEAAHRLHVPWKTLYFASFDEILDALDGAPLPNLVARRKSCAIIIRNGRMSATTGKQVSAWYHAQFETNRDRTASLRGTRASGGIVRGRAVILLDPKDSTKIRNGDILITQMTTPEYVQAMKRAAAFVTDEGGLTSHAAIVARELHKPCVVGTKHATRAFKDGDRVEVDAERGIVRKLPLSARSPAPKRCGTNRGIVRKL